MRLFLLFFFSILLLHLSAYAQDQDAQATAQLRQNLQHSKPDTNRVKLQLELGSYYLYKPGSFKNDLDSAIRYFNQATILSAGLHSDEWKYNTLLLMGNYQFEIGQNKKANEIYQQVLAYYLQHKNQINGDLWETLGNSLTNIRDDIKLNRLICYKNAEEDYRHEKDFENEIVAQLAIGYANLRGGRLDSAEKAYLSVSKMIQHRPGTTHVQEFEQQIALVYNLKGMYQQALAYQLKLIGSFSEKVTEKTSGYWSQAGSTYYLLGMYEKANYCNNKALQGLNINNTDGYCVWLTKNTANLIALKQTGSALTKLLQTTKIKPQLNLFYQSSIDKNFGLCYADLKQNELAGKYYDEMMVNIAQFFNSKQIDAFDIDRYVGSVIPAISFFLGTSQYTKAEEYFKQIAPYYDKHQILFIPTKLKVLPLKIKLDSISGDYKAAFADLSLFKKINDSVYNSTKSRQIAEIQTRYEVTQRERDIKLLQSQGKTQSLEIQKIDLERNITLGSVAIFILLTGLFYNRYRYKQKTNNELEAKQAEINIKNESLQHLLDDKDKLLIEKDWLVKEVHHRVKNNLHTVICLLESQASYLQNDALQAIQISQHRVYSMSLIHQKLYQSDDITTIDISLYLKEFIGYLADSFGTEGKIFFKLDLQSIKMSVAQAIPIALIINEAVTNAIKYAFPDNKNGQITVNLNEYQDIVQLNIIDNGIGIDPILINADLDSLGLVLIKGLTTELKGNLEIRNDNGTAICITFNSDKLLNGLRDIELPMLSSIPAGV